jgi:hypothetical protein
LTTRSAPSLSSRAPALTGRRSWVAKKGQGGDFTILESDPYKVSPDAITDIKVSKTWVTGSGSFPRDAVAFPRGPVTAFPHSTHQRSVYTTAASVDGGSRRQYSPACAGRGARAGPEPARRRSENHKGRRAPAAYDRIVIWARIRPRLRRLCESGASRGSRAPRNRQTTSPRSPARELPPSEARRRINCCCAAHRRPRTLGED